MNGFIPKYYKGLILGGIITALLILYLSNIEFFIINPTFVSPITYQLINVIASILCWIILSYLIEKFSVYKVALLMSLLVISALGDQYLAVFNPITIPVLILFWIGVSYLIMPQFFKKYRIAIFTVYGVVVSYFLIFRMMPNYVEVHHQNFLNFMLLPLPFFGVLWGYEQWRWLKILQADKTRAELTLLKNQIDPHFFFNTLNNLYGLTVEKSDQAPDMILKLSDIMRYTIYEGRADYVALEDEVTYLEDYIELHKIRYQKKVYISFQKDLQYPHQIAPLLLIVPLENAFKHGVESLAQDAFIEMEIKTSLKGIFFQIRNNYEPNQKEGEGIGLNNLRKRLSLIYPDKHNLSISKEAGVHIVSLEIESNEVPNHR
ncbi:MAG: histidine kinase [Bacteroidota bacterium]